MCSKWRQSFHYNKVGFGLELVINGVLVVFCERGHKSFTRGVPKIQLNLLLKKNSAHLRFD